MGRSLPYLAGELVNLFARLCFELIATEVRGTRVWKWEQGSPSLNEWNSFYGSGDGWTDCEIASFDRGSAELKKKRGGDVWGGDIG